MGATVISFNVNDHAALAVLNKILAVLTQLSEKPIMSTTPVSQATFDAALAELVTGFNNLVATGQQVATGLAQVEAALVAAQGAQPTIDLTQELAIVQGLQAQIATDQTAAQALIAGLPPNLPPAPAV